MIALKHTHAYIAQSYRQFSECNCTDGRNKNKKKTINYLVGCTMNNDVCCVLRVEFKNKSRKSATTTKKQKRRE